MAHTGYEILPIPRNRIGPIHPLRETPAYSARLSRFPREATVCLILLKNQKKRANHATAINDPPTFFSINQPHLFMYLERSAKARFRKSITGIALRRHEGGIIRAGKSAQSAVRCRRQNPRTGSIRNPIILHSGCHQQNPGNFSSNDRTRFISHSSANPISNGT